jgi:tripeptide aminopeptidase
MKKVSIDETAALNRYLELTAIVGGSGDEAAVASRIETMLVEAGLEPSCIARDNAGDKTDPPGNVGNLIVTLPGKATGPRTMLSAHMDTVPICIGSKPVRDGDEIKSADPNTGLGADDRSGCAAILTAIIERLRDGGDYPAAVITFLIQEEIGLRGARFLNRDLVGTVDRAFNFDGGTVEKITIGAIGGQRMDITLHGIPAHAGVAPQSGASAIVMASRAIADLDARGWLGKVKQAGGVGTANVGVIRGGDATNVITPKVTLKAEARSHNSDFRKQIVDEIQSAFQKAAASVVNDAGECGRVEFESRIDYESFRLSDDHPSIVSASEIIRNVGREPFVDISNGGLDANWLFRHGIEAVTLGCGQKNIHTANERLVIADYLDACRIATGLLR